MRLDVAGDGLAEKLGMILGLVPTPLVYCTFGPGYGRAIVAGARLGVFDALGDGRLDAHELAARTGCDPLGLEVLCNALTGYGVIEKSGSSWRNTRGGRTWLTSGHDRSLHDAVLFMGWCQDWLLGLEDAVRTGKVERLHDRELPPEFWQAYVKALAAFARIAGKEVLRRVKLAPREILDVGGGHGLYSQALCERYDARATVFDLPQACEVGRTICHDPRVSFREGDFRSDAWGGPYDTILVFNVTHNCTLEEGRALFRAAAEALAPGGTLLVCDAAHRDRLGASEGWNELFFFLVSGARAWPERTLAAWGEEAGLVLDHTTRLWTAPSVVMRFVRQG